MFTKATKKKSKARICLMGPSGSGKTYTALSIAQGLGGRIALIDSEHGSASKYSDRFEFDTCTLTTFSPRAYIQAIQGAHAYDVLIIDSISHEWAGKDGCLEMVNRVSDDSNSKNAYTAWGKVTPQHNDFVEALLALPAHLIATMRVKMDYALETNERGKIQPVKVGLGPVQRDGVEYEFDILASINHEHVLTVTKTRYSALDGGVYAKPGKELGEEIGGWLSDGIEVSPVTKEDMLELNEFAHQKGWTTQRLQEYIKDEFCLSGLDPNNVLATFTKEMLATTKVAIIESSAKQEVNA